MLTYVFVVEKWILVEQKVPFDYRHFLLQASRDVKGKVVIESGSNALHGLDTRIISDYFRAPVIIVSDVGGYPFRKKIMRLRKNLHAGDVLILPLEWDFYSTTGVLPRVFLERIANEDMHVVHYVSDLPVLETFRFVLTEFPLRYVFESLFVSREPEAEKKEQRRRLRRFERLLNRQDNLSFGGTVRDGPEKMHFTSALSDSCDHYLFTREDKFRVGVSDSFRDSLALLAELKEQGVGVYFVWPAIVDSEKSACYSHTELTRDLDAYATEVKDVLAEHGFSMLGDYRDTHFPQECFLNTYYHIRWSCAARRSELLLDALEREGVGPIAGGMTQLQFESIVRGHLAAGAPQATPRAATVRQIVP